MSSDLSGFVIGERDDDISRPGIVQLFAQDSLQVVGIVLDLLHFRGPSGIQLVKLLVLEFQLPQFITNPVELDEASEAKRQEVGIRAKADEKKNKKDFATSLAA